MTADVSLPAVRVADLARQALAPACLRVEIAGSVRRGSPNPHDIELVCVPRIVTTREPVIEHVSHVQLGLIGGAEAGAMMDVENNALDVALRDLEREFSTDPSHPRDGPKYKRRIFLGYKLDIFIVTPPAEWGLIFFIRTGPALYSQRALVTWKRKTGGFSAGGALRYASGATHHTPEESDVFDALGWPYVPPERRA